MKKYLVSIEFRYSDAPKYEGDCYSRRKTVTIGTYNDFDSACKYGNELIENLENKFPLHQYPDGTKAEKERFSKNGGCFENKYDLITNLAFLKTSFDFYAKITALDYDTVDDVINEVINAIKRYKEYRVKILNEE